MLTYLEKCNKTVLYPIELGTYNVKIIIAPSTEPTYADHSYIWVTNSSKIAAILKK